MHSINIHHHAVMKQLRGALTNNIPACLPPTISGSGLRGLFVVNHFRHGERFNEYRFRNDITNEGRNKLLDVMFDGATQISVWYLGIIDNLNYSALSLDDNYDNIDQAGNSWDEFKLYTDTNNGGSTVTRPVWSNDPASFQAISNSTAVVYDVTGAGVIKGLFVVGGGGAPETKGDHAAGSTLWSTALFAGGDATVQNGDQLQITYTVSA